MKKQVFSAILALVFVLALSLLPAAVVISAASAPAGKVNLSPAATIESYCSEVNANEAAFMLIDDARDPSGPFLTKWCATDGPTAHPGEPHWIVIDLKSVKTFDSILFATGAGVLRDSTSVNAMLYVAKSFEIQVSTDNKTWTTVLDVKDNADPYCEKSFPAVSGRYVKLLVRSGTQNEADNPGTVRAGHLAIYEAAAETAVTTGAGTASTTVPVTTAAVGTVSPSNTPETADAVSFYVLVGFAASVAVCLVKFKTDAKNKHRV